MLVQRTSLLAFFSALFLLPVAFAASDSSSGTGTDTSTAWNLTASADENPNDHGANIANLNYYAHAGHLLITPQTAFTLNDQSSTTNTNTDAPTGDSNIASSNFNLSLQYGLLFDGLRIGVAENELFGSVTAHSNAAGVTSVSRSTGLSDPTATAYYRFLEDDAGTQTSGDFNVAFSPSLVNHDVSSAALNGSNGKGYGSVTMSVPLYWWANLGSLMNEVEIAPSVERQFSGNGTGATVATSFNRSAQWVYSGAIADRFHVTPELFFEGIATLNFPSLVTDTFLNNTSRVTNTQSPFYVTPALEMGYRFLRNVVFETAYTYTNFTTTGDSSSTKNIDDTLTMRFLIDLS